MVDNKRQDLKWLSAYYAEYYAFSIHVNQVEFLHKKFGVSAYSRCRLVAE